MEFPDLGSHCAESSCNRLDFLCIKCDACNKVFCSKHFNYKQHRCEGALKKDIQVPICPLCGEPVPTAPDEEADFTVSRHLDNMCKSETKKIFTNRCTQKGCKRKELVPIQCSLCKQNYCLRHRHTSDHDCKGTAAGVGGGAKAAPPTSQVDPRTLAANAAEYRRAHKPTTLFNAQPKASGAAAAAARQRAAVTTTTQMETIQGNMSEDEALARALALSIMELDETADRNRRNEAAAANQRVPAVGGNGQQNNSKDKCALS